MSLGRVLCGCRFGGILTGRAHNFESIMMKRWKKPRIVEICVGMEINSYASADLKA